MKAKATSITFCVLMLAFANLTSAYDRVRDVCQWNTFSLDKKLSDRWSVGLDEELRFHQNVTQVNQSFTNVGVTFKAFKNVKISVVYRLIQRYQPNRDVSIRHRIYTDLTFKKKSNYLTYIYRTRFQTQVRDYYSSPDGQNLENYWRHKFEVRYNSKGNLKPYVGTEFYYQLQNVRLREGNHRFVSSRYQLGLDYIINKKNSIGAYYMLKKEFNINAAEDANVLGVTYGISL